MPSPLFRRKLSLIFIFLFSVSPLSAQWAPLVHDPSASQRIAWWREARFGMFLRWGVLFHPWPR